MERMRLIFSMASAATTLPVGVKCVPDSVAPYGTNACGVITIMAAAKHEPARVRERHAGVQVGADIECRKRADAAIEKSAGADSAKGNDDG